MVKSLQEYAEWLDGRDDLLWPKPPKLEQPKATAYLKPLKEIRAVIWSVYGTLLRITDGEFMCASETELRMQVALEKTIKEFKMWNSMTRKPGEPWKDMLEQYTALLGDHEMAAAPRKRDFPHVSSARIWKKLVERLGKKEYNYDEGFYGDLDEYSEKIAFFFQSCLQGVEAGPNALQSLTAVTDAGLTQGLLADAQPFTLVQLLRALGQQGTLPPLGELFDASCLTFSYQEGVRKPSLSLYQTCLDRLERVDIGPREILYVGTRIRNDLAIAKDFGMRTVLYAGDQLSLKVSKEEMKDKKLKPDRLITELAQVQDLLRIG